MTRRRFVYTSGGMPLPEPYEVTDEWKQPDSGPSCISEAEVYGSMRMPDGSDVSSRKKHREYLRATGMAMASDFKETTPRVRAEAESRVRERREIRETVGRALYESRTQRKR